MMLRADTLRLLDLARWAPSGDNQQPWRVRSRPDGLELFLREDRGRDFLDVGGMASAMALGAFAETASLAAEHLGFGAQVLFDEGKAHLAWTPRSSARTPLAARITERASNRHLYDEGSFGDDDERSLLEQAATTGNVRVSFLRSRDELAAVAEAAALADGVRFAHKTCHEQFYAKVCWSIAQSQALGTVFHPATFELGMIDRVGLRAMRPFWMMRTMDTLFRVRSLAEAHARRQILASGAIGLLEVDETEKHAMEHAGIALQRIWLAAASLGLAMQVVAVPWLFVRRLASAGTDLSPHEVGVIEEARGCLASIPGAPKPEQVAVAFRIGRGPAPSARAPRLSAEALLV